MDDVRWSDERGKTEIQAGNLWADFLQHRKTCEIENLEVLNTTESENIKGSDALRMGDSNYFPIPQIVGGYHYPIVFNNACSSWRNLARNFGSGKASAYIGTATDILNSFAVSVASDFVKAITSGKSVGPALFRAQRKVTAQLGYTPYLMHGYLFTDLRNPSPRLSRARVIARVASAIELNLQHSDSDATRSATSYLKRELARLLEMTARH